MRKRDFILISCLIVSLVVILLCVNLLDKKGDTAYIYHKGVLISKIDLSKDNEYLILEDTMLVVVKDGKIGVKDSNCDDLTCVHIGMVDSSSRPIVCAPNEIYIKIGKTDADVVIG